MSKNNNPTRKGWELSRRSMLRGLGGLIALPALEIMIPSMLRKAYADGATSTIKRRALWFYRACGYPDFSAGALSGYYADDYNALNASTKLAGKFSHLYNMDQGGHQWSRYTADGRPTLQGSHTPACMGILSGTYAPWIPGTNKFAIGPTVNHLVADSIGGKAITITVGDGQGTEIPGHCPELFHSNALSNKTYAPGNTSWTPDAQYADPARLFDLLFGSGGGSGDSAERKAYKKSILDAAKSDLDSIRGRASDDDKQKLDEYVESIRAVELKIDEVASACAAGTRPASNTNDILQLPASTYVQRLTIMEDLLVLGMQCDRFTTAHVQYANMGTTMQWLPGWDNTAGPRTNIHALSHHDGLGSTARAASELKNYRLACQWYANRFTKFMERLANTPDSDGQSLLDNSVSFTYSEIGQGPSHVGSRIVNSAGSFGDCFTQAGLSNYSGQSFLRIWASVLKIVTRGAQTGLGNGARGDGGRADRDGINVDTIANDTPFAADDRFIQRLAF